MSNRSDLCGVALNSYKILYDNSGNITSVKTYERDTSSGVYSQLSSTKTYSYEDDNWKDKLTSYNGDSITYDENGNPLSYRDNISFTWENGRNLSTVALSSNAVYNMKYDIHGLRTQKTSGTRKTYYYYDTNNKLIAMNVKGNGVGNIVVYYYYDNDGNVVSMSKNGTIYHYLKNLQGDIFGINDSANNTVVSYSYDMFGKTTTVSDTSSQNLSTLNPFRFRGYIFDHETGFYYLNSRYYDPETGRFINADILIDANTGSPLSTNMFAYCENCPLYKIDTNGKDAWWIQSPSSANYAGHTSLLIQEKPGYWWYFYWGDKSIQLLFLGTTKAAEINTKVRRIINICNRYSGYRISYDENYTGFLKFHGEFYNTYNAIKRYIDSYCKSRRVTKFQLQVNPDMSGASYRRLLNSTNFNSFKKMLLSATHLKYNGKKRPYSIIVNGNKDYNLLFNNCMQKSAHFLSLGSYKPKGKALLFFSTMYSFSFSRMIPNRAFSTISALRLSY